MQVKTSITNDAESYRRGVIFGLTMAEVLLLLVFCILLFLSIINDRLKEKMRELAALETKFQTELASNQSLSDQNEYLTEQVGILAGKISTVPETNTNSEFSEKMFETAVVLEALDPEKASEILYALNENPTLFQDVQLSTIDEWDELTTEAQYSVTQEEFMVLSQLNPKEKKNLFANASEVTVIQVGNGANPNIFTESVTAFDSIPTPDTSATRSDICPVLLRDIISPA